MRLRDWAIGLILAAGLPLSAQTLGEITGEIHDPSGAVVAGASVKTTNSATGAVRITQSTEAGVYSLPSLTPGLYSTQVEAKGFQTMKRDKIELHVQQTARIDFALQIGEVAEVVDVTGDAPLLNSENATVGTVIENRRIVELPLNGRNFLQLVALSPNVTFGFGNTLLSGGPFTRQGGSRATQNIAIAGQRSELNRFSLDGVENTDANFGAYALLPSIDALQEFKVQSGIYPAEFGRQAGQVNVSTKAGGNQFHGALFEFFRTEKLDAKAYAFTAPPLPKDPFHWNQYGFTLAGPVRIPKLYDGTNRLFFMSNFEGYRDRKHIQNPFTVPTLANRGGDFSDRPQIIFDPATRVAADGSIVAQPFASNVIPQNRIQRISLQLLEFYPAPTLPGLLSNLQQSPARRIDKDQFHQRIDLVESQASTWFGRYSWSDELQLSPANLAAQVTKLNSTTVATNVKQAMISNSRVIRPNLVNEFRFGYTKFFNNVGQELGFRRDVTAELKIPGIPTLPPVAWGIPFIQLVGLATFGNGLDGPFVYDSRVFQWMDTVSWTQGRHSVRFGAEIRRDLDDQTGNTFLRSQFRFDGSATSRPGVGGYVFADFLLGLPTNSFDAPALATVRFRSTSQYYFLQDDWKLRRNLTLSLGLRYENTPPFFDQSGTLSNAYIPFIDTTPNVLDRSRHPVLVRIGSGDFYQDAPVRFGSGVQVARDGRLGDRLIARDNNDFAPRLGLSWSPSARWIVRSGVGVFYSQDIANASFDMARNIAGRRADTTNPSLPDLNWDQPFRGLSGVAQIDNPSLLVADYHRRTPYTVQYLVNVQRQLAKESVLELGYLGSGSRKLGIGRNYDQAVPGAGPLAPRSPYPEFSGIAGVEGSATANYNALAVKFQRRFSKGLTYLAGYTWSRSIDLVSALRVHNGDPWNVENSNCLRCERGLSNFDTAHRFVASGLYELPFGKGRSYLRGGGVADLLFGGWQLGSIVTWQTGFPFTVQDGTDRRGLGGANSRPNATGLPANLPSDQRSTERFFNTAAFAAQPIGAFGNDGRNNVIGPGLMVWDFSSLKNFRVREGHQLQFRFEAFNLPNHPNWDLPFWSIADPNYGKTRATRTAMRELQFGLKYVF